MVGSTEIEASDLQFCDRYRKVGFGVHSLRRVGRITLVIWVSLAVWSVVMGGMSGGSLAIVGWVLFVLSLMWLCSWCVLCVFRLAYRVTRIVSWWMSGFGKIARNSSLRQRFCWSRFQMVLEGPYRDRFVRVHGYDASRRRPWHALGPGQGWSFEVLVPFRRAMPTGMVLESRGRGRWFGSSNAAGTSIASVNDSGLMTRAERHEELAELLGSPRMTELLGTLVTNPYSRMDSGGLALTIHRYQTPESLLQAIERCHETVRAFESAVDAPWERAAELHDLRMIPASNNGFPALEGRLSGCKIDVRVQKADRQEDSDVQTLLSVALPPGVPGWTIGAARQGRGLRTGNPITDACLCVESGDDEARVLRWINDADLAVQFVGLVGAYPTTTIDGKWIRMTLAGDAGPHLPELIGDLHEILRSLHRIDGRSTPGSYSPSSPVVCS